MSTERLRTAFDESAAVYQTARPAYPAELYDDLIALTKIAPPGDLLEIGAGPGTATVDLARRGFRVTVLELGADLAEQARLHLAPFPLASVITTGFESWVPPADTTYGLVYAANAWQWLDPATRWSKTAELLDDSGCLAIFGASHAFPEGFDPFFTEMQEVYTEIGDRVAGDWPPPTPRLTTDWLVEQAEASGCFRVVDRRLYVWALRYDADRYIDLLDTFANHIIMEPAKREHLYAEVRRRLAERQDGQLTRHWISQLAVFRRVQPT